MTACANYRDALADHALGEPASPALVAHLASCSACVSALAELRACTEQFDAGVRQLMASDPSPYLGSRVMAQIGCAPGPLAWVARWKAALMTLAFAAGISGIVYIAGGMRDAQQRVASHAELRSNATFVTAISHWRSPTEALLDSALHPLLKSVPGPRRSLYKKIPQPGEPLHQKGEKNAT